MVNPHISLTDGGSIRIDAFLQSKEVNLKVLAGFIRNNGNDEDVSLFDNRIIWLPTDFEVLYIVKASNYSGDTETILIDYLEGYP